MPYHTSLQCGSCSIVYAVWVVIASSPSPYYSPFTLISLASHFQCNCPIVNVYSHFNAAYHLQIVAVAILSSYIRSCHTPFCYSFICPCVDSYRTQASPLFAYHLAFTILALWQSIFLHFFPLSSFPFSVPLILPNRFFIIIFSSGAVLLVFTFIALLLARLLQFLWFVCLLVPWLVHSVGPLH